MRLLDKATAVVRLSALGDVAMVLAVVREVAAAQPGRRLVVVTRPQFVELFDGLPGYVTATAWDPRRESAAHVARRLRRLGVTRVIDLHNVSRSWALDMQMLLRGARVSIVSKQRLLRPLQLARKVAVTPFIERYRRLLGLKQPLKAEIGSRPAHDGPRRVGIAPFARYMNKTWPMRHVAELTRRLVERGVEVHLFGARGAEQARLDALAAQHPAGTVTSHAGRHTLNEELRLMAGMDAMVAMDSANHHMASLAGTPCVSIWGSTTPGCGFMAWGQPQSRAVVKGLSCQPCTVAGSGECHKGCMRCLEEISPDDVMEALEKTWA